jgi:hypothetical protein
LTVFAGRGRAPALRREKETDCRMIFSGGEIPGKLGQVHQENYYILWSNSDYFTRFVLGKPKLLKLFN